MTVAPAHDDTLAPVEWPLHASDTPQDAPQVVDDAPESPPGVDPLDVDNIAIVGFTRTKADAPWGVDGWELWGLNNLHRALAPEQRAHRWFDLHPRKTIVEDPEHVKWLEAGAAGMPVYVWAPDEAWPSAVPYPKDWALERHGRYFTNSVSWMIALAIDLMIPRLAEGRECTLGVWGIDMAQGTEYAAQRPSCEYFLGVARGLGINVIVPDDSDLLKTASLYGAEDGGQLRTKLLAREQELLQMIAEAEGQHANLQNQAGQVAGNIAAMRGALDNTRYFLGVWTMPEGTRTDPGAT